MVIRFCEIAIMIISIMFLLWVGISFMEIITHNIEMEDYVLSNWNFFSIWFSVQLFFFPPFCKSLAENCKTFIFLKIFLKRFLKLFLEKIFPKIFPIFRKFYLRLRPGCPKLSENSENYFFKIFYKKHLTFSQNSLII